jgi:hypothetical protein
MKLLITAILMLSASMSFADSETECWTDSSGQTHCTTTQTNSGDITPRGW